MALVTLIRPPSLFSRSSIALNATPPISIAYLAGSLAVSGHKVQVIDAVGEAIEQIYPAGLGGLLANGLTQDEILDRLEPRSEIIGISCLFSNEWPNIRRLIYQIRRARPSALIVCGGEHVTAAPEFSLLDCRAIDYVVLGEGEETIVALADAVDRGISVDDTLGIAYRRAEEVVQTPRRQRIQNVDGISLPRWDLVPLSTYLDKGYSLGVNRGRTIPMLATRGCPFQCTFCSSPQMWTTKWVPRQPERVVDEIKGYIRDYRISNVDFYDLTAVVKREWIMEFCQRLIQENLRITWQLPSGTRSEAIDGEVARLLYQSGCRNLSYAPESGSPRILRQIKKKVDLDRMLSSMRASISSGINVKANIMVGYPGETHRDIWKTIRFICRAALVGLNDVGIWVYSPYPGSELFEELRKEGKIKALDDDYFISLQSYADINNVVSWSNGISSRTLKFYRLFGWLLFYSVRYLSNPQRFFRTIRNLVRNQHESRLETVLMAFLKRSKLSFQPSIRWLRASSTPAK